MDSMSPIMAMEFPTCEEPTLEDDMDEDPDLSMAHQAAASGETDVLRRVIQANPTLLEQQDSEGMSPLAHAVMAEHLEVAKLLVKMGAGINTTDHLGRTCLSLAAYQGWYDGVQFLLRNGASQSVCDKAGRSALHSATYATDTSVWKLLLQNVGAENLNQQDLEGMTPLHWAAFHNRPAHTAIILERGANPRVLDVDSRTALHWAAQNGSRECCAIFLETVLGRQLVNHADFSDKTPLHFAAAAGHADIIQMFARSGYCMLEPTDPDERTPLHWAAAMGQAGAVAALLEQNVDPAPEDADGNSPLDYAIQSGHQECVDVLEEKLGFSKRHRSRQTANGRRPSNTDVEVGATPTAPSTQKKTRFAFLAELFRPNRKNATTGDKPKRSNDVIGDSSASRRESASGVTLSLRRGGQRSLPAEGRNASSDDDSGSGSSDDTERSKCSLPRVSGVVTSHANSSDVVNSIRKLQYSRQDNPLLAGRHRGKGKRGVTGGGRRRENKTRPALIDTKLAATLDEQCGERGGRGTDDTDLASSSSNHNNLIRSPPPMLPKDIGHLSPSLRQTGTSRARLEEDVAQILALRQPSVRTSLTPRSLTSLSSRTDDSSEGKFRYDRASIEAAVEGDKGPGSDHSSPRSEGLAPIKGAPPATSLVHQRLQVLRRDQTGVNRSPTPPAWHKTGSSTEQNVEFPAPARRRRKKKITRVLIPATATTKIPDRRSPEDRGPSQKPGKDFSQRLADDVNVSCTKWPPDGGKGSSRRNLERGKVSYQTPAVGGEKGSSQTPPVVAKKGPSQKSQRDSGWGSFEESREGKLFSGKSGSVRMNDEALSESSEEDGDSDSSSDPDDVGSRSSQRSRSRDVSSPSTHDQKLAKAKFISNAQNELNRNLSALLK